MDMYHLFHGFKAGRDEKYGEGGLGVIFSEN